VQAGAAPAAAVPPAANTAPPTVVASASAPLLPLSFFQDIPATASASAAAAVSAAPAITAISAATAADPAASATPGPVAAVPLVAPATRAPSPMFASLYQGDDGPPVGSVVRELWGARRMAAVETPQAITPTGAPSAAEGTNVNAPLDLLQFMRPSARGST